MKNSLNRITVDSEISFGKPVIRGMRYSVELVLDLLSAGMSSKEIIEDYPELEEEDITACLQFAAKLIRVKSIHKIVAA